MKLAVIILIWFVVGFISGIAAVTITKYSGELVVAKDSDDEDYMFLAINKDSKEKVKNTKYVLLRVVQIAKGEE